MKFQQQHKASPPQHTDTTPLKSELCMYDDNKTYWAVKHRQVPARGMNDTGCLRTKANCFDPLGQKTARALIGISK